MLTCPMAAFLLTKKKNYLYSAAFYFGVEIKIYTVPSCTFSDKAKKFFKKKKIKFEEITLVKNEKARLEIIEKSGQMVTPIIEIDGEIVVGFDEERVKKMVKGKK